MSRPDAFAFDGAGLQLALDLLRVQLEVDTGAAAHRARPGAWPTALPETGQGEYAALRALAPLVIGGARHLGAADAFAHMDPPTPWITWATTLWNSALNQNLLHPDTAPVARDAEQTVIGWLLPLFGMAGGHMTAGSTLANLTALWAARDGAGVRTVVASAMAHNSVAKAARILGLDLLTLPVDRHGRLDACALPADLSATALVLTAGTTSSGSVDDLSLAGRAAWTHIDAAWAGALRLSARHAHRLDGIEAADSVAVSAHKWLYQPKDSAIVLFREPDRTEAAISSAGAYLAAPNIGVMGSRSAAAIPLAATLLAWGRDGMAMHIDRCMALADRWHALLGSEPRIELHGPNATGVVLWRPRAMDPSAMHAALPDGAASLTTLDGTRWLRNVAANPGADIDTLFDHVRRALGA